MNELYFRDRSGMYIHSCVYEEYKYRDEKYNDGKPKETFTHKNLRKTREIQLKHIWAANKMPDTIEHFTKVMIGEEQYYKVPTGVSSFFGTTEAFLNTSHEFPELKNPLYEYQEKAVNELLCSTTGLMHAKTGTGKTYMMLEIARRLQRRTLIVVHNLTQLEQMVDDVIDILGFRPLAISGKKLTKTQLAESKQIITVLNIDSRDKIKDYTEFGTILFDECDMYLGSDDRREWIGSISAEYQYGFTGTTKINYMDDHVFDLYYGNRTIIDFTLLTPKYMKVYTPFEYILDNMNDYHELLAALYSDEYRNNLIVSTVMKHIKGRKGLVFTAHVEHARLLERKLQEQGIKTFLMIGEVSKEDRKRIRKEAKEHVGELVIIGSVKIIGRGFDLPELSLGLLTTSEKFEANIDQYVGRILRPFEGKPEPLFIDMIDLDQRMLYNQAKTREKNIKHKFPDTKIIIGA